MFKSVLVPLDGSPLAEKALEYAQQIVETGGKITLLSVIDVPHVPLYGFYYTPVLSEDISDVNLTIEKVMGQAKGYLEGIVTTLTNAGYQATYEAHAGEPAAVIAELAETRQVDAIVMSTHGRSGLSRWIFGSVTNKVLTITSRPVLVIPSRERMVMHDEHAGTVGTPA